ncbi:MAG: 2OG-Fe(II) oxygenase [Leptolyngbya sp. IPPAS B-1204]|nr:2OG-Fe(II) oxygenase [Elainella sp. C42_A2020_010]RNJ65812.1 MAG: bacteriocin transporter [Leptolyngbya sp. IPPAS B-1204]
MTFLTVGDPVPWFTLPSTSNPNYHFDTVGGYRVVLFFFGSTKVPRSAQAVKDFCAIQSEFTASSVPFFGVSIDPEDQKLAEAILEPTYCKFLWDFEQRVSQQYGVCGTTDTDQVTYRPTSFVLDENLRVLQVFPLEQPEDYVAQILNYVRSLPPLPTPIMAARQAPVLFIPRVLDPDFCRRLVQLHQTQGGRDSGFMRDVDGKTVEILDYGFKKRRDINLADTPLLDTINQVVLRRIKPEIEKAYQFSITRFERHIVACYDSTNQGFFNRHRDNTTKGTAHRRFAMTLNLNTGEYEGGCLRFPEYGSQLYRPDVGEAVIFSCSLLHEATPVTSGQRFALLSFFYGDEDALVRERNRKYLADNPSSPSSAAHHPNRQAAKTAGFQPKSKRRS